MSPGVLSRLRLLVARACLFTAAVLLPALAWAQDGAEKVTKGAPKSFVPNYALVVLLIALVVFAVCKPSHRADNPKPRFK